MVEGAGGSILAEMATAFASPQETFRNSFNSSDESARFGRKKEDCYAPAVDRWATWISGKRRRAERQQSLYQTPDESINKISDTELKLPERELQRNHIA